MQSHLQLVKNTITPPEAIESAEVVYFQAAPYRQFKLGRPVAVAKFAAFSTRSSRAYVTYAIVIGVHLALLVWMLAAATQKNPVLQVPKPMMVSLVANPAPAPKVALQQPASATPAPSEAIKKTPKPINKQVETPQAVAQQVETMEAPTPLNDAVPQPSTPAAAVSNTVNADNTQTTLSAPVASESPAVESPKFGAAYLYNPPPAYPPLSRRLGEEGRALLRVLVTENGTAETVDLESSSGSARLDKAAIAAVKRWEFVPAKRNQQSISAYVLVPIKFSLTN